MSAPWSRGPSKHASRGIVDPPVMPQGHRTALLGAKHADAVRNLTTSLDGAGLLQLTTLNSHMTRWCQCAP
ncbi:hypothetical protein DPEC_G00201960 [Dallia pectoralis]|uniref:Uncharacterized protein n=1 Tax=Dallia pectoralis TaxID=75939 RepID=A0ACC2G9L4_DALPE|nr:hypothetical protein DPEC_G00201960 [Dallia pectoralis]